MVTTPSWRAPVAFDLLCDEATAIFPRGNGASAFWWMRRCIGDGSVCVKEFSVLGLRRCGSGTSSCVLHIGGRFFQLLIYVLVTFSGLERRHLSLVIRTFVLAFCAVTGAPSTVAWRPRKWAPCRQKGEAGVERKP